MWKIGFWFGLVLLCFGNLLVSSIKIRVWIKLVNPVGMKKKSEQDSSDLMGKGKEESTLTFKNLNLGN